MVSAYMGVTRGSGVLASAGDVLEMSVVRGVGGVCYMCICLPRGGVGGVGDEWVTGLGLGFTNSGGTWGKWDMCLCFGCGGVGCIGGEWVGGLVQGGWGVVMSVCVVRLDIDGRSMYLHIVLGGFLPILCAPSVQSCCTLSISAS